MARPTSGESAAVVRSPLVILVSRVPGSPAHFAARLEGSGEPLVASSRQPFCDVARELIALGFDPRRSLIMRHGGAGTCLLKAFTRDPGG
jgi:hypothetical protein